MAMILNLETTNATSVMSPAAIVPIIIGYLTVGMLLTAEYASKEPRPGWKVVGCLFLWPFAIIIAIYQYMDEEV